ncbi:MAG: hydrogenase expression/formation protein HypE [Candidatus Thermoplasmatota archaeon]|jgi:hydrogenase expression/formation protein HypE|nr:hydrogenase expression/formation protein HypE [Candidatus Thermoplasmatota archaeon]
MAEKIQLAQGAGGQLMDKLIKEKILKYFKKNQANAEVSLTMLDDSAVIDDIVFTTDSHTVYPIIFPGGDLGSLAVAGTINDISVIGAKPIALSAGFIVEEGLSIEIFEKIVKSMSKVAKTAGVPIITGDTKVVEKGAIQEFMINTSGIGKRTTLLDNNIKLVKKYRSFNSRWLLDSNLRNGDKIILSGNIGEHGITLMSFREGYGFETKIKSDIAPVNGLMEKALSVGGIVSAKDPTRGGLANTVCEFSDKSNIGIILKEEKIPIPNGVKAACNMLGIDPLEIGNEGKVVLGVVKEKADEVLEAIKKHPLGKNAAIIGEASKKINGVVLETKVGGKRNLHKPLGDPVPRIC